jgi:hypothetical protein
MAAGFKNLNPADVSDGFSRFGDSIIDRILNACGRRTYQFDFLIDMSAHGVQWFIVLEKSSSCSGRPVCHASTYISKSGEICKITGTPSGFFDAFFSCSAVRAIFSFSVRGKKDNQEKVVMLKGGVGAARNSRNTDGCFGQ